MPSTSQDIRQTLLARDPEFRNLAEEHSRCESQLEQILKSSYLNSEDLITGPDGIDSRPPSADGQSLGLNGARTSVVQYTCIRTGPPIEAQATGVVPPPVASLSSTE
jgi:hypothetical protein